MLYDVIVTPLVYIVDLAFSLMCRLVGNPGTALIGVSLVVNFLCLPLYRMADRMQEEERQRQQSMARWVEHVKRTFKGDEQYMMLSTYYRQQDYKPIYALNGSLSLLLQIPVFMAAYNYLSSCDALQGASYLFLSNLGAPDQLLNLGTVTLNLMPILMTLLNCVSTYIYTRDLGIRDKVQAYGLALVFLVLLYQSPSGLVFYWTCNQLFSLVKNVFLKVLKKPDLVFGILVQLSLMWAWGFLIGSGAIQTFGGALLLTLAFVGIDWPILSKLLGWQPRFTVHPDEGLTPALTFLLAAILMTLLTGVLVPSALIGSSPMEFVNASGFDEPIQFVVHTGCVMGGLFILWVGTYYFLSEEDGRKAIAFGLACLAVVCLVNYFAFAQDLGIIGVNLVYEDQPSFSMGEIMFNLAVVVGTIAAFTLVWKRLHFVVNPLLAIMCAGLVWLAVPNVQAILTLTPASDGMQVASVEQVEESGEEEAQEQPAAETVETTDEAEVADGWSEDDDVDGQPSSELHTATQEVPFAEDGTPQPILNLSREGRNVMVIFLDRAISGYIPYLFNERPDLYEMYDGFTYYPNTISYGWKTVFGASALLGGYDYVPEEMNDRSDELLSDKHDEALRLMPTLFSEAGYDVTLCDPPLVNYTFSMTDYSLFDSIPNTKVYHTQGAYTRWYARGASSGASGGAQMLDYEAMMQDSAEHLRRNLCYYSLFRVAPTFMQENLYDKGSYLEVPDLAGMRLTRTSAKGLKSAIATSGLSILAGHMENADIVGLFLTEAPQEGLVMDAADGGESTGQKTSTTSSQASLAQGFVGKHAISNGFLGWYSVLASLTDITAVEDGGANHFILLQNSATHDVDLLQMPNYEPSLYIDNTDYLDPSVFTVNGKTLPMVSETHFRHYMSDMGALLRLGEWFNYLREQGCYDNTRIIIVADHGQVLGQFDELQVDDDFNAEMVNPLFMVKDFDSHGFETSDEFMTNADTPNIALRDVVDNPVNPFTGNPVNDEEKTAHDQVITTSTHWQTYEYQTGTTYDTSDGSWYSVHDNIFDPNNWQYLY